MVSFLDDTAIKHTVTLNGNQYVVTAEGGDIAEQNAAEFAVQIAQGPPSQDTRENLSYWTMANWTPGLGIKFGDFREHQGRFWDSQNIETRHPNELTLAPLRTQLGGNISIGTSVTRSAYFRFFKGNLYLAVADKVLRYAAAAWSEVLDTGTAATTDLVSFLSADGTERLYVFTDSGRFQFSTDGTTWTQSDVGVIGYSALEYDQRLLIFGGVTNEGEISSATTADGAAASYTSLRRVAAGTASHMRGAIFRDADGSQIPYIAVYDTLGESAVYAFQVYETIARTADVSFLRGDSYAPGFPQLIPLTRWNDKLYIPAELSVTEYEPGSGREVGPAASGQGLPTGFDMVGWLVPGRENLFALIGRASVYRIAAYTGQGWHFLSQVGTPSDSSILPLGLYLDGTSGVARLYWAEETLSGSIVTVWYMDRVERVNPIHVAASTYAATGRLITPWMSGGFDDLDKILFRMRIRAEQLTTTETVVIDYQLDDSGADGSGWTNLGTFDAPTDILRFGASSQGIGARSFRFRITLNRGATTTLTPIVRALTLDYLVTPEYRAAKQFVIDLGATIRHRGEPYVSIATLLTEFETAFELGTLPAYAFDNDTETRVKVVSYATNLWDLELPDPQTNAVRDGMTRMQVMELIA